MLALVIDLTLAVSAATFLFIVARALPRVGERGDEEKKPSRLLAYLEKGDSVMKHWSEKTLRRVRVVIMKFDNFLGNKLSSFRKDAERTGGLKLPLEETISNETLVEEANDGNLVSLAEREKLSLNHSPETVPELAATAEPEAPATPKKRRTRKKKEAEETKEA